MGDIAHFFFSLNGFMIVIAYLLGSIPFGLIFSHFAGLGDVRSIGSGNIGATNVLRTGHKKIAAFTLLADMLKGTVAVVLSRFLLHTTPDANSIVGALAGLFAFLGHLFPIWLGFKGGKGVASYIGVLLGLLWPAAIVFGLVWLGTALITRYSSLAALIGVIAAPVFVAIYTTQPYIALVIALMSVMVIGKHHSNIKRLFNKTESKIGAKSK